MHCEPKRGGYRVVIPGNLGLDLRRPDPLVAWRVKSREITTNRLYRVGPKRVEIARVQANHARTPGPSPPASVLACSVRADVQ